ncbi:MAG TPA: ATP-binding protein, partial [Blastocatellia bacterium]|nr:ATP-binding protein [Blastocatellia bacterium]
MAEVSDVVQHVRNEARKAIVGQDAVIEQILVALLTEGHVLIEGVPGTAKTLLARVVAGIVGAAFG